MDRGGRAGAERFFLMGAGADRPARQAARGRQALRHHVDGRQAWRSQRMDRAGRDPLGKDEPRPSRPGLGDRRGGQARFRRDGRALYRPRNQPPGRCGGDFRRRRRQSGMEVADRQGLGGLCRARNLLSGRPRLALLRASRGAADRRARSWRRPSARRSCQDRASYQSPDRHRRLGADGGRLCRHRNHQQLDPGLGDRGRQVLRLDRVPLHHPGRLRRRPAGARESAGRGARRPLAGAGPAVPEGARRSRRLHQRPSLRRRQSFRRGPDGGGRQGPDRRRRAGGQHPARRPARS